MGRKSQQGVDWSIKHPVQDYAQNLRTFRKFLANEGYRESSVDCYTIFAGRYLKFVKTPNPTIQDATKYREYLIESNRARSTINNYCFSVQAYHRMLGEKVKFPVLRRNNQVPYFFTEEEISKIFNSIENIKHLAILKTLFYGCLRVSELSALCDEDLSLKSRTIRVRDGKGGKEALVPITQDRAETLREYLRIRPKMEIDGEHPLFYTDKGRMWDRREVYRLFIHYKEKAGLKNRPGGAHVFARHSAASIMIKNGCDILTIKDILRHSNIETTARYLHMSDKTKREKYEEYLVL